ncbi:MAG: SLC13 family permease [Chitinophagales bacterium]|jgi:di/tricarboxylate transporter|nr:SLC13 family permease [Chitinophagales bacterium]
MGIFEMSMQMQEIIVLLVTGFIIFSLYKEKFPPALTFFIGVGFLLVIGILTPKEMLGGFANDSIITIMLLLVVCGVLNKSALPDQFFHKIFGNVNKMSTFLLRMMFGVAILSAFLNNTPIVAFLIPFVYTWSKSNKVAPSKLMIPLSFATVLGGTITLIGTSTNLVVNGLTTSAGIEPLKMFDFTIVGGIQALIGVLYLYFFRNTVLPDRPDPLETFQKSQRDFLVEGRLKAGSGLIGKSVESANLRQLKNFFLVEIIRNEETISPVSPKDILRLDDILIFAGDIKNISELVDDQKEINFPKTQSIKNNKSRHLIETILMPNSDLIGQSVKECDLRGRFDAAVVAIHRRGEQINGKLGNVILKQGDVLVLFVGDDFDTRTDGKEDFFIINEIEKTEKINPIKSWMVLIGFGVCIIGSAIGFMSLFQSLLVLLALIIFTKTISFKEMHNLVDYNLLILAALALALGEALTKTGAAADIANGILYLVKGGGPIAGLAAIYFITMMVTEIMTNVAAATLAFPLAISLANSFGVDPKPFILAIAFAASASFLTPVGYQTNLMVYGPGGYKFIDYVKVGLPLSVLCMIVCVVGLGIIYGLF